MKREYFFITNNFRIIWIVIAIIFSTIFYSYGQDPIFTQFYSNPVYLNPAASPFFSPTPKEPGGGRARAPAPPGPPVHA